MIFRSDLLGIMIRYAIIILMEINQLTQVVGDTKKLSVSNHDKWTSYSLLNNNVKQCQPAQNVQEKEVVEQKTKYLKEISFTKKRKKRRMQSEVGKCPRIKNGILCGGSLKEYKKKIGKRDSNGLELTRTYLRCNKKGCQTYRSLNIINTISQPILEKKLDILDDYREKLIPKKKISQQAATEYDRKEQGKAKNHNNEHKNDILKNVVNENEERIIAIKKMKKLLNKTSDRNNKEKITKEVYTPEENKKFKEIAVNTNGGYNLDQDPIPTNDFICGQFVVSKTDMLNKNNPPIWKITNFGFLQKYIPFKKKSNLLYKSTLTFAGWIPRVIKHYYLAPITFIHHDSKHIIKFHKNHVEIESVVEIPTKEEVTGVLEEAMSLAVSKKIFKSQHVTGGLQTNFINAFKDNNTFKVSVSNPCTSAETSDYCSQPDKTLPIGKKLQTADKIINESSITNVNRKSTRATVKRKCCCHDHIQETRQTKKDKLLDNNDICEEVDLPGQIPNINLSNEFTIGSFIVHKTDMDDNNPTLWKITNFGLLQKYCPFQNDDEKLYRNTLTYCSWNSEEKNQYNSADVSIIHTTQKDHLVKLNKIMRDLVVDITTLKESSFLKTESTIEDIQDQI